MDAILTQRGSGDSQAVDYMKVARADWLHIVYFLL